MARLRSARIFGQSISNENSGKVNHCERTAQTRCSGRRFYSILVIGRGKNPIHSVEYSIRRSCAIWYCATQSLYDRMPPVEDRASCLPESSRRALVADAREIRQYQMHPRSLLRNVTDTQSVALLSSPGAALASALRIQPLRAFPLLFTASRSFASRSAPGRHNRVSEPFFADFTFHFEPSTVKGGRSLNCRNAPKELASQVFLGHATSAPLVPC